MKLAYAACQASKHDVSFSQKTTMLFRPDQSGIERLVNRNKNGNNTAKIDISREVDCAARKNIWIFYKKSVLEK